MMKINILSIFIALVMMTLMVSCVSGDKIKNVTPLESQLIANTVMLTVIKARDIPKGTLVLLRDVFVDAKNVLVIALKADLMTDSTEEAMYTLSEKHAEKLGPYYPIVQSVLTVAVFRVRSAIDQDQTDLASQYLEAVLNGTIAAINTALKKA